MPEPGANFFVLIAPICGVLFHTSGVRSGSDFKHAPQASKELVTM